MINFEFSDESFESQFVPLVETAYSDVSELLDGLPDPLHIKFTAHGASEDTGVGGFALSDQQINLAVYNGFSDRKLQQSNLRGTVFHESLHVHQGFTNNQAPFTALEAATYEGCSLIFEQQYTDTSASYGDYSQYTNKELTGWLEEIREIGISYFEDGDAWRQWASYHPEYQQKWLIYKVGSWLVGRILAENNLDVLDLKDMSAEQILALDTSN